MNLQLGTRVVRGPDWRYSDHDGGLGHAGTVTDIVPISNANPPMVQVSWDNGITYLYRCGPHARTFNLRVLSISDVENPPIHQKVCKGCDCNSIRGTRWECVSCNENYCSVCFLLTESFHNKARHKNFHRYDDQSVTRNKAPLVSLDARKLPLANGGFFVPECLRTLVLDYHDKEPYRHLDFSMGDHVMLDPSLDLEGLSNYDYGKLVFKFRGITGEVVRENAQAKKQKLWVRFRGSAVNHVVSPECLVKLNEHSVNDSIRIRDDEMTSEEIKGVFGDRSEKYKLEGCRGVVIGIDNDDPKKVVVKLDDPDISVGLGLIEMSIPSNWMTSDEPANSFLFEKYLRLNPVDTSFRVKHTVLLLSSCAWGDMRIIKLLRNRFQCQFSVESLNAGLRLAVLYGNIDVVEWLLAETNADIEQRDRNGNNPLLYSIIRYDPAMLVLLLSKGALINSQSEKGNTALHRASSFQLSDCVRVLLDHGAEVDVQNNFGQTALSIACDRKDLSIAKMLLEVGADVTSVSPEVLDAVLNPLAVEPAQLPPDTPGVEDYKFTWFPSQDGHGHGYLTDHHGSKYNFKRQRPLDRANLYKCSRSATLLLENGTRKQRMCGAIACRSSSDGAIWMESPHIAHSLLPPMKKHKLDVEAKTDGAGPAA